MVVVTGCSQVIIVLHYTLISIVNSVPVTLQCDWYRVYYGILKDAAIPPPTNGLGIPFPVWSVHIPNSDTPATLSQIQLWGKLMSKVSPPNLSCLSNYL